MLTYVELKEREKSINEQLEAIKQANVEQLEELDELKNAYPDVFSVLPEDYKMVNFYKIHNRFEVIKEDIELSKDIPYDKKPSIIKLIDSIEAKIEKNNIESKKIEKEFVENTLELEKRRDFLIDKKQQIDKNNASIKELDIKIKLHQSIADNKEVNEKVREAAQEVITKIEISKEVINGENEKILSNEDVRKDLDLINEEELRFEDRMKRIVELENVKDIIKQKSEVKEKTTELETDAFEIVEVEEQNETTKKEEESKTDINSLIDEGPQEVVEKHKASPELISKIKKAGKIGLGVLVIGAAVAAVIMNPLALAVIPAGGLIYNQAKEQVKKK